MLKWRSVSSIVIAPAKTGREATKRNEVINTDHAYNGILNIPIDFGRIFIIVTIILIAPRIEDAPAKCMLSIAISTEGPACPFIPLRGGYRVQPVPAPSIKVDAISK